MDIMEQENEQVFEIVDYVFINVVNSRHLRQSGKDL